jgi:hypothetical protein
MKFIYIFIFVFFTLVLFCILGNYTRREGLTVESTNPEKKDETSKNTSNGVGMANRSLNPSLSPSSTTYDNYNHYNGDSLPTTFYGADGSKLTINKLTKTMYVTDSSGKTTRYVKPQNNNMNSRGESSLYDSVFTGEDGGSGNIVRATNGQYVVNIKDELGNRKTYSPNYNIDLNQSQDEQPLSETDIPPGKYSGYNNNYNDTESNTSTTGSADDYINSLPRGIPANNIPPGQEHLYILKSQIVPPVCPVCPSNIVYRDKECSPCPACARCPEPSFECKKVPNYNAQNQNNDYLPVPVLSNFSGFGM